MHKHNVYLGKHLDNLPFHKFFFFSVIYLFKIKKKLSKIKLKKKKTEEFDCLYFETLIKS